MDERDQLRDLVDAARTGDADAQGELFDRYHAVIYRYALARLRSAPDAEDATAETFLSAIRAMPGFRWRGVPFEAWLFRIARSKVVDQVRRRDRVAIVELRSIPDPVAPASGHDPPSHVERAERSAELARALDDLPDAQRDVLIMRFLLGRSIREVADRIGRSEGAVKQLQARGLAALRGRLGR
jgi:RNA polymerase sigma-70 factor (ECF subfamily)